MVTGFLIAVIGLLVSSGALFVGIILLNNRIDNLEQKIKELENK